MMRINKQFVWIVTVLVSAFSARAQQHQFTATETADYAKQNNAQVKNALLQIKIQQQINRGITSAALPQLTANGNLTDNLKIATQLLPGEFLGQPPGTFIPVQFGTKYTANGGFALNQVLFDGQVFVGLQARRTSIDLQQKTYEVTEESIRRNIYKIYYQLVVAKTQLALVDSNIARLEKLQHDTKAIYTAGFAEKLDVNKVEVQLANLQTQRVKVISQMDIGYVGLKTLIGMPIKDTLILTEPITDEKLKDNLLQDSGVDYSNRKDYQTLELTRKLREYNIKRYKLAYIPTLSFTGNYSYSAQRSSFDFLKRSGTWFPSTFVALNLKISIFDGFAKAASVQQSKLELQQTINLIDDQKIIINGDVEQARLNYTAAISTIDFQKKNMALAEEVYRQTKKKYEIGTGNTTEINAAQTDLVQAQTNYTSALYDAIIARVDYMWAMGKLQ